MVRRLCPCRTLIVNPSHSPFPFPPWSEFCPLSVVGSYSLLWSFDLSV